MTSHTYNKITQMAKFFIRLLQLRPLNNSKFHENPSSKSHALLKGVDDFLPIIFLNPLLVLFE